MIVVIDAGHLQQPLAQVDALPGRGEIDLVTVELDLHAAVHLLRHEGDHLLGELHDLQVIGVSHVELELGELGVVLEGDALVAEIAPDLVDPVQPAHDQPLEIQLEGNAQEEILVQLVVVGDEGLGRRAAVERLQDGRFHLDEAVVIQELAQRGDDPGALAEDLAHLGVDRQVGVALPVAGFRVRQGGVPHHLTIHHLVLGGGQRRDRLGQHFIISHLEGDLVGARAEELAGCLDVIAQVEFLVEQLELLLAQVVDAEEELQFARSRPRCGRR